MCLTPLRAQTTLGVTCRLRDQWFPFIEQSLEWPFEDQLLPAAIQERRHKDRVPPEALAYQLRETKSDNPDGRIFLPSTTYFAIASKRPAASRAALQNPGLPSRLSLAATLSHHTWLAADAKPGRGKAENFHLGS